MTSANPLKIIRLAHHYLGVFFAPTILFFAITGGLQMFGLHETSRGSSYTPPAFLVHLSQLHKKGTLFVPPRRPQPSAQPNAAGRPDPKSQPTAPQTPPPQNPHNPLPEKIFFAATAIALVLSTLTGLVMAWRYNRSKSAVTIVFIAGIILPVLLLAF